MTDEPMHEEPSLGLDLGPAPAPAKPAQAYRVLARKYRPASFDDLIEFFKRLPNPDKQFSVMAGISHASFQQKNYMLCYHILHSFFCQPEPLYRG